MLLFSTMVPALRKKKTTSDAYFIHHVEEGGYYRIDGPEGDIFSWQLFHVSGRLVLQGKSKNIAIVDTSSMRKGLYIIKVNGKAGDYSEKILRL